MDNNNFAIHPAQVNKNLFWTKNRRLLSEMCSVSHDGFWLDRVNELRNTGVHRNIINIRKSTTIEDSLSSKTTRSSRWRISFTVEDGQTLQIIPYLDDSIQTMKVLIESIISKEPLLRKR
jgi:hypothetical protein